MGPDSLRAEDEARDPDERFLRVVVEQRGQLVAYGEIGLRRYEDDPACFSMEIFVDPACEGRGIGGGLYGDLIERCRLLGLRRLHSGYLEAHPYAAAFAEARGFRQGLRHVFSRLDLTGELAAPTPPAGVHLTDLGELYGGLGEDETHRRLFPLVKDFTASIPGAEEAARNMRMEQLARNLRAPEIVLDGYIVAVHGAEFVGKSDLRRTDDPRGLWTGTTGVHCDWRRKGIATALKRKAIQRAAAGGYEFITTANAETNHRMLALNGRLGFRAECAYQEILLEEERA